MGAAAGHTGDDVIVEDDGQFQVLVTRAGQLVTFDLVPAHIVENESVVPQVRFNLIVRTDVRCCGRSVNDGQIDADEVFWANGNGDDEFHDFSPVAKVPR